MQATPASSLFRQGSSFAFTLSKESQGDEKIVEVTFEENDRRNPINFPRSRKWAITIMGCMYTFLSAASATAYTMGFPTMIAELNCTQFQATLGLSVFALGFGVIPLVTSAFSEEFGRQPLYIISTIGFALTHLMLALAPNIQIVIVARFLQGAFGSTGATLVAGTVTDVWDIHERGLPMSIFSAVTFIGNGLAASAGGWIAMNEHLRWRWIHWIQFIIVGTYCILVPIVLRETRSAIVLLGIAQKLSHQNPGIKYRVRAYEERASLKTLIWTSCTRPIHLLCTEPIVISQSLWIGFAWGVLYCMFRSIPGIFKNLYGFNTGAEGNVFITMVIGSVLGFFTNFYQEKLYRRNLSKRWVEGRLYLALVAALFFPIGMYIYALTSISNIHWIVPIVGITIYMWATFTIYQAVFTYLADCYGPYASSALAGQNLIRYLMGAIFPLFTQAMFRTLTYKWGNTLFASIAVLMIPIPYVMFFYGPVIRRWSRFSQKVY
ncbi:major facilitator superfamily domain-containing protein [Collybia nuda]|uniref:Major facilitator superfamily domain-containing protein n=1 Tax=Collybia nuda TaxID=64659 RepID=A0A9P5Y2J2_9AGAR|nr:major facilitator superfamily domain-containing protein [Collybia nuda]